MPSVFLIWFETAFVTPLVVAGFPAAAFWLLGAMLLIYPVWVAIGLYQEPRWKIVLKTLLSMGLISLVLVAAIIGLIEIGILPDG